mgnify:CR=1 FL=1
MCGRLEIMPDRLKTNRSIKILYILDHYHTSSGGTERQIYELIEGLDKNIFETEACIFRYDTDYFDKGDFPCPVFCLDIGSFFSLSTYYKLYKLRKYICHKKFNIIQTIFNDSAISIPLTTLGLDVKLISTRRDMGFWYTPAKLLILKLNSYLIDRCLVNSIAVRDNVHMKERMAQDKIAVIYNGHDFSRLRLHKKADLMKDLSIPEGSPIVGIVANMRPVKRVNDLIVAFSRVQDVIPESYLIIVGHLNDLSEDYKNLVRVHGIEDKVRFLGSIQEPVPVIKHFSVGVNCSETGGLSNSIIEYMACGIPVVATDTSGNRELINDGKSGILVPVGDPEQLGNAIIRILKDKQTAKKLSSKAEKFITERFKLDIVINQYTDFYIRLVEG